MKRNARGMTTLLALAILIPGLYAPRGLAAEKPAKMIGMYVHQHWPYNHPYCARTWSYEDWKGYVTGLHRLGYNFVLIWPVQETMPDPPTASDLTNLKKIGRVIDMMHKDLGMKAYIALCPNVIANSAVAAQASFEKRHFFHCDLRVNPADPDAVARMIDLRERLMRPVANVDGLMIIDSDPGGYPGSNNREFIHLLAEHRKMLDRLRPGIELVYWMHAGWPAYCRLYEHDKFAWGTDAEFAEALTLLKKLNPAPWGLASGLRYARQQGLESRVISLRYGVIEGEPSFPLTRFGGTAAYDAGARAAMRGVLGNAQTHCVQLPNTFAFVRGALGKPVTEADYVRFADDLIPGYGSLIVQAWQALGGSAPVPMRDVAGHLSALTDATLATGRLGGLLFGDPHRFIRDLTMQLRFKAAREQLVTAAAAGQALHAPFTAFVDALATWQKAHGYQGFWSNPRLDRVLKKLNSPAINAVLKPELQAKTPFGRVKEAYYLKETYSTRLLEAMQTTLESGLDAPRLNNPG